jgi:hypothetical protein
MNRHLNEAETRAELIDPALKADVFLYQSLQMDDA